MFSALALIPEPVEFDELFIVRHREDD